MIDEQPQVDILLATFCGAELLEEQINSLLKQSYSNWKLIVRDDASADSSSQIIETYATKYPEKICFVEDGLGRLGPVGNFSHLLMRSRAEYTMLCDQDDIWLSEKIALTMEKMLESEKAFDKKQPILIHSDLKVVNGNSSVVAESFWRHQNIHPQNHESLNRILVQNVVTGCTVMINSALRNLALPVPDTAVMHDWWLALVAAAFGTIEHINQSTILYRQHGGNEVGAKRWGLPFIMTKTFDDDSQVRMGILNAQRQAHTFLDKYYDKLPEDKRKIVECYATLDEHNYLERIYLLIRYRLFKVGFIRNLGLWTHI